MRAADHTRAAPRSSPGFFALAVSVTPPPCGTRSTAASLHSSSWLSSAYVGNTAVGPSSFDAASAADWPRRSTARGSPGVALLLVPLPEASDEEKPAEFCATGAA